MPYIKQDARNSVFYDGPSNAGELNFAITHLMMEYVFYQRGGRLSYQKVNDCLGALEGAKMEFYRRIVVPYEEEKMKENGDVY